ncbi:MAG: hypothetical protein KDD63_14785, partial [Bacteroidetes bacterium]|nr:hypothetical protein [Bacteroidota bacterium]
VTGIGYSQGDFIIFVLIEQLFNIVGIVFPCLSTKIVVMKSTLRELKETQSVWDFIRILLVFAITGTTSSFFPKWIMPLLGMEKGVLYWITYILLITPIYFTLLLVVAFIFGKFTFFFEYEKKMLRWFAGSPSK